MVVKVTNRERIPENRIYTLEQCAIYYTRKVMTAYRNGSMRELDIQYLLIDITEDLVIHVSAYSCPKEVALLAPDLLCQFSFALRYDTEGDSFCTVEDADVWVVRIAQQLYHSVRHYERLTVDEIQKGSKADAFAYVLHRVASGNMDTKTCVALLKAANLEEVSN